MERRKFLKGAVGSSSLGAVALSTTETVAASQNDITLKIYRGPSFHYTDVYDFCDRIEKLWDEGECFASGNMNLNAEYGGYVPESTLENYLTEDGSGPLMSGTEIYHAWNNYCHENDLYSPYESHHWIGNFYNWGQNYGTIGSDDDDPYTGWGGVGRIIPYDKMEIGECSFSTSHGDYYDGYLSMGVTTTYYSESGSRRDKDVIFGTLIHEFAHNAMHPAHAHHNMYDYSGSEGYPYDPTCMAYNVDDCTAGESMYYSDVDDNAYVWGETCGSAMGNWLLYGEPWGMADSSCQVKSRCHGSLEDGHGDSAEDLSFDHGVPANASERAKIKAASEKRKRERKKYVKDKYKKNNGEKTSKRQRNKSDKAAKSD